MQLIQEDQLRWEIEWACDECGNSHDGDWGRAPENLRRTLLAEHGKHCLQLAESESHGGRILKAFRDAFKMSIQEARAASNDMAGEGYCGTSVEILFLQQLLEKAGVRTLRRGGE